MQENATSGTPPYWYRGYIEDALAIRITRLNLTKGKTERFRQKLDHATFLYHGLDFLMDEISPNADRVAFSDGAKLCIYDDTRGKLIEKIKIPQKPVPKNVMPDDVLRQALFGVWWKNNDKVIIRVVQTPSDSFHTYEIPTKTLTDVTGNLLPLWTGNHEARNFRDTDWYKSAIK